MSTQLIFSQNTPPSETLPLIATKTNCAKVNTSSYNKYFTPEKESFFMKIIKDTNSIAKRLYSIKHIKLVKKPLKTKNLTKYMNESENISSKNNQLGKTLFQLSTKGNSFNLKNTQRENLYKNSSAANIKKKKELRIKRIILYKKPTFNNLFIKNKIENNNRKEHSFRFSNIFIDLKNHVL